MQKVIGSHYDPKRSEHSALKVLAGKQAIGGMHLSQWKQILVIMTGIVPMRSKVASVNVDVLLSWRESWFRRPRKPFLCTPGLHKASILYGKTWQHIIAGRVMTSSLSVKKCTSKDVCPVCSRSSRKGHKAAPALVGNGSESRTVKGELTAIRAGGRLFLLSPQSSAASSGPLLSPVRNEPSLLPGAAASGSSRGKYPQYPWTISPIY